MIESVETENGSCDHDNAPFRGGFSSVNWDMIWSICVHNMTLASAVPETLLGAHKYKTGHVTLSTPLLMVICYP